MKIILKIFIIILFQTKFPILRSGTKEKYYKIELIIH